MTIYAYKRCSTNENKQDVSRQLHGKTFDEIVVEYASGKDEKGRPLFQELKQKLLSGDELHFNDLSRAGRNTKDLLSTVEELVERGVKVVFHSENLTFVNQEQDPMAGAISKMLLTMLASVNELFLTQNKVAIKQGLQAAKEKGVKIGAASPKHKETYKRNKEAGLHKKSKRKADNTELIIRIRQMVSDSNNSLTQNEMVDKLNAEGWKSVQGKVLSQGMISKLLKEV
jgi:DNA invertase Pin-like site-specific DNA recombinase